jgi:hypothetical protein
LSDKAPYTNSTTALDAFSGSHVKSLAALGAHPIANGFAALTNA